jgi:hypothetical protein
VQQRDRGAERTGQAGDAAGGLEGVVVPAAGEQNAPYRPRLLLDAQHRGFETLGDDAAARPAAGQEPAKRPVESSEDRQVVRLSGGGQDGSLRIALGGDQIHRDSRGRRQARDGVLEQRPLPRGTNNSERGSGMRHDLAAETEDGFARRS